MEVDFKFCLCGYYGTDGKGIPHHSDTVPTYNDLVVSLSFGAPRIFQWHEYGYHIKKETFLIEQIYFVGGDERKVAVCEGEAGCCLRRKR